MTQAKRKLKDISFEKDNAHIALVTKQQSGPANGHDYTILMKSRSEEFVKKASEITVTMDIVEYLNRFFHIWSTDAELLARSLGFTTPGMEKAAVEMQEDALEEKEPPELKWDMEPGDSAFEKYINYKLQSISVMKKLNESKDIEKDLLALSEDEMLAILKDQEFVEKNLFKKNEVKEITKQPKKGNKDMSEQIETIEKSKFVDLQKSLVEVQKALDEKQVELTKALETIKQFEDEKKEAIQKSRLEELTKAVGDEAKASAIFAGCKDATDEVFTSVVKALADVTKNSSLFNETGAASDESEVVTESLVTKAVKARIKTN